MMIQIAIAGIEGLVKVIGQIKTSKPVINDDGSVDVQMTITVTKAQLDRFLAQQEADSLKNKAEIARRKALPNQ